MKEASLYFHIPFCTKKCPYCHFYVIPNKASLHTPFTDALLQEWDQKVPLLEGFSIVSIYFGGGTPTLLPTKELGRILQKIRESNLEIAPNCEITIEANPENNTASLFKDLISLGFNRLSIGVQSLDDRSLQTLERTHSAKKAKEAVFAAASQGFDNISIDLMYDLPDQTQASWEYSLSQIAELPIQHLSLYNLTIEPHTSFYKRRESLVFPTPSTSLQMLESAVTTLERIGLTRYEISAFAKENKASQHNLGYWKGRPFLGFGPSACSFWNGKRMRNISHLEKYAKQSKAIPEFEEKLPYPQNIQELLAVRLRLLEGAPKDPLWPQNTWDTIKKLIKQDLLQESHTHIQLTEKGLLFHDTIAIDLIEV